MQLTSRHAALALATAALTVPAAAGAAPSADRSVPSALGATQTLVAAPATPSGDGTLILRAVNGLVALSGKGSVIAQVTGKARLYIEDTDPTDGVPVVTGADRATRVGRFGVLYTGTDIRFRMLGAQFHLKLTASTVNLSFVGRGTATLTPSGTLDDGQYSLDGGDTYRPVMLAPTTVVVGSAISGPPATTAAATGTPELLPSRA